MGRFFGVNTANIDAVATAEASPANAMTCVKPFTIPDKWIEKQDPGGYDSLNSTFDKEDSHGDPCRTPTSTSLPISPATPATTRSR